MIRVVNVRGMNRPEQRSSVVYVGRPFAGWKGHQLANPFRLNAQVFDGDTKDEIRGERQRAVSHCLDAYRAWLMERPKLDLELVELWEACRHGELPLGCWCCNWDGMSQPSPACHAVILAEMLRERFA